MPLIELSIKEHFLLEIFRSLEFLRKYDYQVISFFNSSRATEIVYNSGKVNREIRFLWDYDDKLVVSITNKTFIVKIVYLDDLYRYYKVDNPNLRELNSESYLGIVHQNVEFIKAKLKSIIAGNDWPKSISKRK